MDDFKIRNTKIIISIIASILLSSILFIDISSAIFCDTSIIQKVWTQGQSTSPVNVVCTSSINSTVSISQVGSYFSSAPSLPTTLINESKTLSIQFNNLAPTGVYPGFITFSDSSTPIYINITVLSTQSDSTISNSPIIVFPTSKIVTVQQGSKKNQNLQIIIPSSYPSTISLHSVSLNPEIPIVSLGDLDLGVIQPGQTVNIPIIIDTKDAQTGTYSTQLTILATNSTGQISLPASNLQITVTSGVTPVTNDTFAVKPTCALSAVIMNINNTYSFTCSGVQNNLEINPQYNDYFEGTSVESTSNLYIYRFKPVKYGNANFIATYTYKGAPIFNSYNQDVKISSSGSPIPGTDLNILFTPSLSQAKSGQEVIIQLVDNRTNSLVNNPFIYVNAVLQNSSYKFEIGKNYQIRGTSTGYNDIVMNINLTTLPLSINIFPLQGDTQTSFTINTSIENASLLIDDVKYNNPYTGLLPQGNHRINAYKEGFLDASINFTVESALTATPTGEFKKGNTIIISLSKNVSWSLVYQKSSTAPEETLQTGTGSSVEIKPSNSGIYKIISEGKNIYQNEITGWNNKILGLNYWWYIGILLLGASGYYYFRNNNHHDAGYSPYSASVNT